MLPYEAEQFLENLTDMKEKYLALLQKCEVYEAALERADGWAVPDTEEVPGSFHYIPYQLGGLVETLIDLAKLLPDDPDYRHSNQPIRPLTFVEVGCGIGRNLNLVRAQNLLPIAKSVGFDIVPEYVETAQKLFGLGKDVFVNDAMTFDYAPYDLIFFYRPFSEGELERKFEEYLIESAKSGAIIIGMSVEELDNSRRVMELGDSGCLFKVL